MKLLVYKDCKKNIHRVMKFRADRKNANNANSESTADSSVDVDGQFLKDNLTTMEKMHQLRTQLELKKKDKQNSKLNVIVGDAAASVSNGAATSSFGEQCVNNLMKMTRNDGERRHVDAINSGAVKKDSDHLDYWNVSSPIARRMYFPPIPRDAQMPFKKSVDGSAMLKKPIRNEFTSFTNEFSNYPIVGSMLNKHGTAKTCLRSSMLTQKPKQPSEASPSTAEMVTGAALFDPDPNPTDVETFRKRSTAESDEAMKTKVFGQHLIELIRTSKMPLSPSWQDISDAKAKFEATYVPSMAAGTAIATKKSSSSDAIATAGASSTASLNELHVMPLSQSMTTMTTASTATRNFSNSTDVHRSKIRDNIRRNRSFKALISNDYIIEENNHHNHHHHHHHQHQQQHQYQSASSTTAASLSSFNPSRQYSSSAKKSKMPFNSVHDLLEKFNSSTKLKGQNAHSSTVGGYNCYYNDVRSNESLSDSAKLSNSSTAPFPLPRTNSCKSSLFIDLKSQFDNNEEMVKSGRRMSTPKFSYGFENKLFVENSPTATPATTTHQHHHTSIGSRDKRKSFSGGDYKYERASSVTNVPVATPTSASIGSSAATTAIADSSSFRVFKMASDGELLLLN